MIALLVLLNLVISSLNAWSTGRSWFEAKTVGGLARFMAWMGAIMSACGFTWCYAVVVVTIMGPSGFHKLKPEQVKIVFELAYLAILLPIIGSGLAITIQSWAYAWKTRRLGDIAVGGWNGFAQIYNITTAVREVPGIFEHLGKFFSSEDDEDSKGWLVALAILICIAGIMTTYSIVQVVAAAQERAFKLDAMSKSTAGGHPVEPEYRRRRYR